MMQRQYCAKLLLIAALVLVLGYFGLGKLLSPILWIGWIPPWMEGLLGLTRNTWLIVIGIGEMTLALLLLIPVQKVQKVGAALVALHLMAVITQVGFNVMGIRDTGLFLASVALFSLL